MDENIKIEEFVVTARKFRPMRFSDVVGQDHVTKTLQNSIKNNRVHHAFLFCGPRGVGKTTTARILARALNCLSPVNNEPCNECDNCKAVINNRSMDIIEIDGASNNGVDDIRNLRENAKYPPVNGKYKMYIIDEVHMLSKSAFNALLKILEEPPKHLLFVFATTESHKVLPTIISRCQRYDFRRMEINDIIKQLSFIAKRENITIEEEALVTIAKKADGSMRDSESIFDQVVAFCGKDIKYSDMAESLNLIDVDFFFRISDAIAGKNISEMFNITREVVRKGYDLQECLHGILEHFRNLLTIKVTNDTSLIESSESYLEKYRASALEFTKTDILRVLNLVVSTDQEIRFAPQPKIRFELSLVQLASIDKGHEITELLAQLKNLQKHGPANTDSGTTISHAREISEVYSAAPTSPPPINQNKEKTELSAHATPPDLLKKEEPAVENTKPESAQDIEPENVPEPQKNPDWAGFLQKYGSSAYGLTLLSSMETDFRDNCLVINCRSDFEDDSIKQNKSKLIELLNDYFGKKIDLIINCPGTDTGSKNSKNNEVDNTDINSASSQNNESGQDNDNKGRHPVEKKIIELFDAREIRVN